MTTGPPVPERGGGSHPTMTDPGRFDALEDRDLLRTRGGLAMPRMGLGTWQLSGSSCQEMVEVAVAMGYRHVDTAQMYGNERAVGAAIRASGIRPDEIFLTTKIADGNHEPEDVRRSLEESLSRLGVDSIDLVLVHWPVAWERMGATLSALAMVHAAGTCRHIGVSNFTVEQLDSIVGSAPIEALQVECHPYLAQRELRAWCQDHGFAFVAYSPLAQGDVSRDQLLIEIAADVDATPAQVALAWSLSLPGVAVIPRTSDQGHLAENWQARRIDLDEDAIARIAALDVGDRRIDPPDAPWNLPAR